MTITVTGATGQLGRLVIADLLERGIPASEIVAAVRNPAKAGDLAALRVQIREADYTKPETLVTAFAGTHKLLLISSSEVGQRVDQHRNVVEAAVKAGVGQILYTSVLNADTSRIALAAEHKATEDLIRESGVPFVFLRNGWYLENYTANLAPALENGVILGSTGQGRVGAAARADLAAAAAAVLASDGHDHQVYELAADLPFTIAELAAEVARQSGKPVSYLDLPAAEYAKALAGFGVPQQLAEIYADSDLGIGRGELSSESGDLSRLIGRPTISLVNGVAVALR
ncbi:MAG TPA: NAD(P)-dependent oxidoreductase [Micromonosporaceae bacterium]|nr:NAD(P)-dependent oxidoreductase [Micromonosporaceae bacterium]